MFEGISEKLNTTLKKVRGQAKLSEENLKDTLREVRLNLLEADVNFKVVKEFVAAVTEKAVGKEVLSSLSPGQQVIKVVHEELIALMGSEEQALHFTGHPTVILVCGLQGSGKTTTLYSLLKRGGAVNRDTSFQLQLMAVN